MNARRTAAAVLATAGAGTLLGATLPYGSVTTLQSVATLGLALGTGLLAGRLMRSRWAAVITPVTLVAVVELLRLRVDGPTVDGIDLTTLFGTGAFVTGRGFDAVLVLLPLVVGALWGAASTRPRPAEAAHTSRRQRAGHLVRRTGLVTASAVVGVLALGLVRPAATEPVLGADGEPLAGSVAELATVPIGGHDQSIMLRGNDSDAPVLLWLEGGPGGSALGAMRYAGEPLEEHFVVATWDQRGTGKSAAAREPLDTFTVDQAVADTIEVTEYLTARFDERAVYLVGSSWGTTLGVLAAQQRPDLFHAYVGVGQMVDQAETDRLMYAESLDYARRAGDVAFEEQLLAIGPPPYANSMHYPIALSSNPEWLTFTPGEDHDWRAGYPVSFFVAEYTLTEQMRSTGALAETFHALYPQLQDIDLRRDAPELEVPVFMVKARYEADGRSTLADEWFALLEAPAKEQVTFERSGHTPQLDEPGRFCAYLEHVLSQTSHR